VRTGLRVVGFSSGAILIVVIPCLSLDHLGDFPFFLSFSTMPP
jgi:hypothetical protein